MKAVIFARVSSDKQEDNNSLDAQTRSMKTYCSKKNFEIIKEIRLVESSTRGERELFYEMIDFIKKQRECIALIVDAVDRLQRSFKEVPVLEELRMSGKLVLHFLREHQILDKKANAAQIMGYQMFVLMAANYANTISDNVKRGFSEKRKNGESLGHVPTGYLTKDGEVTLDPFKSILVKELFEEYSTGLISIPELAKQYSKKGLTTRYGKGISKSQVDRLVSNPFYYGYIEDKDEDDNKILRPHKYEKLINKELFDMCQGIKSGRGYHKYKRTNEEFAFSTLLSCSKCNVTYSSYVKKGHVYLHPTKKKDCDHVGNIAESELISQVVKIIKAITIPEDELMKIKEALKGCVDAKYKDNVDKLKGLRNEYENIDRKISNLYLIYADDMSITTEERTKTLTPLRKRKIEIEHELSLMSEQDSKFETTLEALLDLASRSHTLFESSQPAQKREILKLMFANLKLNGRKLDFILAEPFNTFLKRGDFPTWSGQRESNPHS